MQQHRRINAKQLNSMKIKDYFNYKYFIEYSFLKFINKKFLIIY